jgi:endonuclease G, mitochondrial
MRKILALILIAGCTAGAGVAWGKAKPKPVCHPENQNTDTCRAIWEGVGLPSNSGSAGDKTEVCHDRFVTSNDNASKTPDWVVELLTKKKLTNKYSRPSENFSPDPCVPANGSPDPGDYSMTPDHFAIGHMAPSEDFNNSIVNMRDTFYFSNAVPQVGAKFNGSVWKTLENEVRKAAVARNKIYVITGPVRGDGAHRTIDIAKADNACGGAIELDGIKTAMICKAVNKKKAATCATGVVVPVATYKVVYDPQQNAAYAFVLPNRDHPSGQGHIYLEQWRVNVGVIEKLTGLKFFGALPADKRAAVVDRCQPGTLWPATAPKAKSKKKKPN